MGSSIAIMQWILKRRLLKYVKWSWKSWNPQKFPKAFNALTHQHYVADLLVWLTYIPATSHFVSLQLHHTLCMQCALWHPNFIMCKAHRISSTCCSTVYYLNPVGFEWIKEAKEKNISKNLSFQAPSDPFFLFIWKLFQVPLKTYLQLQGSLQFYKNDREAIPNWAGLFKLANNSKSFTMSSGIYSMIYFAVSVSYF